MNPRVAAASSFVIQTLAVSAVAVGISGVATETSVLPEDASSRPADVRARTGLAIVISRSCPDLSRPTSPLASSSGHQPIRPFA
jgi:hypothetical protein